MSSNLYQHGDWRVICQRCGRKKYASQTVTEWTGLIVCHEHADTRNPQDYVRGRVDRQKVAFARPVPEYDFVSPNQVTPDDLSGEADLRVTVSGDTRVTVDGDPRRI